MSTSVKRLFGVAIAGALWLVPIGISTLSFAQGPVQVADAFTVDVSPTVSSTTFMVRIYNTNLAAGSIRQAFLADVQGSVVRDFHRQVQQGLRGAQRIPLAAGDLAVGVYYVVLQTASETITIPVVRISA